MRTCKDTSEWHELPDNQRVRPTLISNNEANVPLSCIFFVFLVHTSCSEACELRPVSLPGI